MKTQLLNSMVAFTLGTGATILALASWTGTTDLQAIKSLVENHMTDTEQQVSLFVEDYKVQVNNANAEIEDYQEALAEANDNISQLITAYEQAQASAEQDLSELQAELDNLYSRMDSQYETQMNEVIEQANVQIEQANTEVAETKQYIEESLLPTSQIDEYIQQAQEYDKVNTGNDKSVTDISSIVPSEEQGE